MCESIEKFFEKKEVWTLIGVALGFLLAEGSRWFREFNRRKRVKGALRDELDTNLHLIEQKKDTLRQMIQALEQRKILPGESVHSASIVYTAQISLLSEFLKPLERDSLHVVYERLRVADKMMDEFEYRIKKDLELKVMKNPWAAYKTQLTELSVSYDVVQSLIKDFIAKKPRDVFYRHDKKRV